MTADAFANAGYARDRRRGGIDVAVLARNLVVRGVYRVTEFDRLNRTAVRKIFTVYPCAYHESKHRDKHEQGRLLRGPECIEYRDRQIGSPLFRQEFAR